MKIMVLGGLFCLLQISVAAEIPEGQTAPADSVIQRADKLPLPTGCSYFSVEGEDFLGYSSRSGGALVFGVTGNSEAAGGSSSGSLIAYSSDSGKVLESVDVAAASIPGDPEPAKNDQTVMEQDGKRFLQRWSPTKALDNVAGDFNGWAVEIRSPDPNDSKYQSVWRLYVGETHSTWLKPLIEVNIGFATQPYFKSITTIPDANLVIVMFERGPFMEFDRSHRTYVLINKKLWAQFLNEVGFQEYTGRNYSGALNWFSQAIQSDTTHVVAIYNAACTASLLKQPATALEYLLKLRDNGGNQALQYLNKVASDHDFDPVRADAGFAKGLKDALKR